MSYNLSRVVENTTGILSFTQGVNEVIMDGWLGVLILVSFSTIILISYLHFTNDPVKSVAGTAFITLTMALLLRAANLIYDRPLFVVLVVCALALAGTFGKKN